ncbi:MAG: helix-turn-helix domain-containing protein [Armatimonadota bacterium]
MTPGSSDGAVPASGKTPKPGKEARNPKEPKEAKKPKEDAAAGGAGEGKNSALLRQMAADLAAVSANFLQLRSDVDTLKGLSETGVPSPGTERSKKPGKNGTTNKSVASALTSAVADSPEIAVALIIPADHANEESPDPFLRTLNFDALKSVDTGQLAKLGYAFSSVPKVALIRMLLENGEQTASQLGEGAGLTTGSLYHHLRELVHAEVAFQSSRNRYALTDLGRRSIIVLLALQS